MVFLIILLLGVFISAVSVFIGLGGGFILVPLLPSVFGLTIHQAVGTSLFTIFLVMLNNTYRFYKKDQTLISWPVVLLMGPVSSLMAFASAQLSQKVNSNILVNVLLTILILVGFKNLISSFFSKDESSLSFKNSFKNESVEDFHQKFSGDEITLNPGKKFFSILGGALAGLAGGFVGIGSGVVLSPLMIFLKMVKPKQLSPTANANMLCTTSGACLFLFIDGFPGKGSVSPSWPQWGVIRLDIALGLFVSSVFFSHFLRPHQNKLPMKFKSILLSVVLGGLIFKIIYFGMD